MAVDETLAQMSNTLIYSAMLVYTGAMGAFATDLSIRGRRRAGVEVVPASAASAAGEKVAVGASGPGTSLPDRDETTDVERSASSASSGSSRSSASSASSGSSASSASGTKAGGIAVSLTWLAFLLHLVGVVVRGLSVQRVPWGNAYEFCISGAVVVTAVYLAVLSRRDIRYLGTFVVGPVLLSLGLAVTVFYVQAAQLVPALQSVWLLIHVSVAFVASAVFTLGFSTTILQLVQERRERARAAGARLERGRFMDALPNSTALEGSSYSLHMVAFPLWTFTLVAGAIWAESAWGRYWNWDPKEVWTFVIWVVYAAYLHARATRGWDGRRAAYFALVGYACIIVNFTVVNIFFKGWHSYSGL